MPTINTVGVIGTGVIGRSWALVFAGAGCETRLCDASAEQLDRAHAWIEATLASDAIESLMPPAQRETAKQHLVFCRDLPAALSGAGWVQESGPEDLYKKQAIFAELDRVADASAILASSTSVLDIQAIAAGLGGVHRCIVAHPVNPPHVVPVVEVLPTRNAPPEIVERACAFLASVGQTPVRLKRYVPGFILNRLQSALVREAIHLVMSGVADVDAVDTTVRDGIGLRWAVMGPFGLANTNSDGGVRQYYKMYGHAYETMMNALGPTPPFDDAMIETVAKGTDTMLGSESREDQQHRRDRLIARLRQLKREDARWSTHASP